MNNKKYAIANTTIPYCITEGKRYEILKEYQGFNHIQYKICVDRGYADFINSKYFKTVETPGNNTIATSVENYIALTEETEINDIDDEIDRIYELSQTREEINLDINTLHIE